MNFSLLNPLSFNETVHTRSVKELRTLSKEFKYKHPREISYHTNSVPLDQSDTMKRYRTNIVKSRIKIDKNKTQAVEHRNISSILDPLEISRNKNQRQTELVNSLGFEVPEVVFTLTNNLEDLKKQLLNSEFNILAEKDLGADSNYYINFIKAGIGNNTKKSKPAGRKDIEDLEHWIDYMLTQLLEHSQNNLFESAQLIYSAALHEIIRQVGVHCVQRAELLERIWKAYFNLMVLAVHQYQKSKMNCQIKARSDVKIIENKYKETKAPLVAEVQSLKAQVLELNAQLQNYTKSIAKLKYKQRLQEIKHSMMLKTYEKDKIKLFRLEDTNRNLNYLVKSVLEDIDKDIPGMKKLKEKNKIRFRDISRILITDPFLSDSNNPEPEVPESDMEEIIQREIQDLENKVLLQEIKERIEETEEELVDVYTDTTELLKLHTEPTQTDFDDFPESIVSIESIPIEAKRPEYEEIISNIISDQIEINEQEMEFYFNLQDFQIITDSDDEFEDFSIVQDDKIFETLDSPAALYQIKNYLEDFYETAKIKYQKILRKNKYYRNRINDYAKALGEIRKAFYLTLKQLSLSKNKSSNPVKRKRVTKILSKPPIIEKKHSTIVKGSDFSRKGRKESTIINTTDFFSGPGYNQ
jgi:Axonemal dynein light chain